jgi:hypothetical protein
MRRFLILILPVLFLSCAVTKDGVKSGLELITAENIAQNISFLASDSLKGRNTPSPELDIAGNFIAERFMQYGLKPVNGSYFQRVEFVRIDLAEDNALILSKNGEQIVFKLGEDFIPFNFADGEIEAKVIFAGYGITAKEYGYDDYEGIDAKGKIVVVLRDEPQENDTTSVFNGKNPTRYSFPRYKAQNAFEHGAVGVIILPDPLNHSILKPRGYVWPKLYKNLPRASLPIQLSYQLSKMPPSIEAGENFIKSLFGDPQVLKDIQRSIDETLKPKSFKFENVKIKMKISFAKERVYANNVVGLIEGEDEKLKDEVIIVGAHYDHVGYITGTMGKDSIYNGADDNASGTVGMIEVAKAFALNKKKPKRSLLFIAFCGEEKGLLGSRYYVDNPLFPIEKTVAMINLDMIGRNAIDSLILIGWSYSEDMKRIAEEENQKIGFKFSYDGEKDFSRSDQANFAWKGIPVIFFHSGEHEDYHKVSDEVSKINFAKIAKVAKLCYLVAYKLANSDFKPKLNEDKLAN